jgi:nucleotide-binding universal stress UspA family protein
MRHGSIVVGTDGTVSATETVRHGAALARKDGATLHIVSGYRRLSAKQRAYETRFLPHDLRVDGLRDLHLAAKAIAEDAAHAIRHRGIEVRTDEPGS